MENRKDLFEKTLTLLIDAWDRGELQHGMCATCAEGNICGQNPAWSALFQTWKGRQVWEPVSLYDVTDGMVLVKASGYTIEELARIEYAFEISIQYDRFRLKGTPEGQYLGLCAVIDVLTDIHQIGTSKARLNRVAADKGVKQLQPV